MTAVAVEALRLTSGLTLPQQGWYLSKFPTSHCGLDSAKAAEFESENESGWLPLP
jgi:hypothetical protein